MNLEVLLYKWDGLDPSFDKIQVNCFTAQNFNEFVQHLHNHEIDLIVVGQQALSSLEIEKIYKKFQIPFLVPRGANVKKLPAIAVHQQHNWVYHTDLQSSVDLHRQMRQAREASTSLQILKKFESDIPFASEEVFLFKLKTYFQEILELADVHWISFDKVHSSAPLFIQLLAHLKKQKSESTDLLDQLESYESEYKNMTSWQIWQDEQHHHLVLLWLEGVENQRHCLILNKIQNVTPRQLSSLLELLVPLVKKRWDLCLFFQKQEKLIYLDSLTNLYNQKYLNLTLDKKIEENRRYQNPFSILFIDIDYFKQVNDSLGHVVGSDVLKQLGQLIQGQVRGSDYAFRYGGDEFIVLLSHTQGDPAQLVAERIRTKVQGHMFKSSGHEISITVSIGLAFFPEHASSAVDIIRIADEAMYYGKNVSRNIVYKAS